MVVKDIVKRNIVFISANESIQDAAMLMDDRNIGSLLIRDKGQYVGIITERDIMRKVVAMGKIADVTKVRDIMSPALLTIDINSTLEEAQIMMDKKGIRRLVVTEKDRIVGIITQRDVANSLVYSFARRSVA